MSYLVWEVERAPTTGTEHIQGYVRFTGRFRMEQAKRLLHQGAHLQPARGSEEQNRTYCLKDGTEHEEHGEFDPAIRQGRRTDLEEVTSAVINRVPLNEVARRYPQQWIKYHSGLSSLHRMTAPTPQNRRSVTTTVLYGATGVGKSHRVRTAYPSAYIVRPGRDPWSTYSEEEVIIFEEFVVQTSR